MHGNIGTYTYSLCAIFMILVSLENVKKYSHVVARLPQRLKSTLFEIFSHSGYPSGSLRSKKFQTMLILAFEANSSLSCENETKIVKITHSATYVDSNSFPISFTKYIFECTIVSFCMYPSQQLSVYFNITFFSKFSI